MKKGLIIVGAIGAGLFAGCLDQTRKTGSGPLLRSHFAGRSGLAQDTNASRLRAVEALPATAELRADFARKLAKAAFEFWRKDLPADATEKTALLEPLLGDLMVAESLVEVRGPIGKTETVIAAELPDDRARLWSTNLWQVVAAWKFGAPHAVALEGARGWEARRSQAPATVQFAQAGKWIVVGLGQSRSDSVAGMLRQVAKTGRALPALTNGFWDIRADLPGLSAWFPIFSRFPLPPAQATLMGRGENVRTELRLQYPVKVPWASEPWRIPTNLVSEPLTSFTVARGIAPLLDRITDFPQLGLKPTPNQLTGWGISNDQCRVYIAAPVPNSTNALQQLAPTAPEFVLKRFRSALGDLLYASNRHELVWGGLPWVIPNVRSVHDAGSDFLLGSIFPLSGRSPRAPDELYAQVRERTNLVYYDWEDTPQRLDHSRQLYQLASLVDQRPIPGTNSVSQRWLIALLPKLGNAVTEITQTGPQELTLVRKSQLGLTGFELATFAAWLDSPGFPFRLELPPPKARRATNSPAAVKKP